MPSASDQVVYRLDLNNVDWAELKATLAADMFDNGRTPEQLERSFRNSHATCLAYLDGRIIGTARVLSDGVCNAYLLDVWTHSAHRRRGIASRMVRSLIEPLRGQHVYLQSDDAVEFYRKLGFAEQPVGLSRIVGRWLVNT
jgi:ribosomal protein S18 acetylase RimI-like enzyme